MPKHCCQCNAEFSTPGIVCSECREARTPKWKNPLRFLLPEAEQSVNSNKGEEVTERQ